MPQENKTKKRSPFAMRVGIGSGVSLADIRSAAQNDPGAFMLKMQDAIDKGDLTLEKFNLRDTFRALVDIPVPARMPFMGEMREITTGAFPLLTGNLVVNRLNDAYDEIPTIGEELVDEMNDPKKFTTIASIHSLDVNTSRVDEGDPFPEIGAGEEKVTIGHNRNGRKLSITAEAIEENEIADFVRRVNALAFIASDWIEEQTLERVCDKYGSNTSTAAAPYVYMPDGVGAALYSATANTPGTKAPSGTRVANNPLVDYQSLDSARTVLVAMLNNRGKRISLPMSQMIMLVPDALVGVATMIRGSELVPGVENQINPWGPRGQWQPRILSTPKLDDISTSAWYLGAFKQQFVRKWKLNFEYITMAGTTQEFLDRRVAFQARIAWDVEVGATEYVKVIQNLDGTTYTP